MERPRPCTETIKERVSIRTCRFNGKHITVSFSVGVPAWEREVYLVTAKEPKVVAVKYSVVDYHVAVGKQN